MQDGHEDRRVDEPGSPSDTRQHLGPWLRALAGLCLAAVVAGGAAIAAGGTAGAGALIADPSPSGSCSSPPVQVPVKAAATAPAPMYCLNASPDDMKVHLTWDPAAPVNRKPAIYYGTSRNILEFTGYVDVTGTGDTVSDATVSGLTNGTMYYFWIVEDKFPHVVSNMVSAIPVTKPGAPTGLTATAENAQLTVSWTAPGSTGGSQITGYYVYAVTTGDFNGSAPVAKPEGTTVTLPHLVNGTTYYLRVTAVNRAGEGPPSNEVQAVPLTVPGAPTELTATAGNAGVTLSWTAPGSTGGSQLSGYVIYKGTSPGGETGTPVNGSPITATSYDVTGLANGTTYYFTVTAVNGAGEGQASNEALATPVTTPGAPTWLAVTPGNAQATLSWAAPASDGGSKVTGYDLYVGTTAGLSGSTPIARVTSTVVTVTGLVNGTTYYVKVTAVNRIGVGPASTEMPVLPLTVPGAPTRLVATPGNAQATLSWAAPASGGAAISGYLIYQGTSPRHETRKPVNGLPINGTSYTVTGLANGTTYYFRVTAVNTAGEGPSSAEVSLTLQPIVSSSDPPASPTSSATTPTSSATTPTSSATTPTSSATTPTSSATTPTSSATTPTSSATTPTSSATTPTSSATTPTSTSTPTSGTTTTPTASAQSSAGTNDRGSAAPTGLTATPGNAQVHLSWIAAAPDGGSAAAGYRIYLASRPGMQAGGAIGTTKGTDVTVARLANGTTYYFMVTAVGPAGDESPFSAQVAAEPRAGVVVPVTPAGPSKSLIALLAAAGAMAVAGALTWITRHRRPSPSRKPAHSARSGEQAAMVQDVRAVPDTARPDMVSVHDTGREPTHTVRLEPDSGITSTTIKEGRP
jgi:fibronectin type 3 domain-containing protein